MKRLIINSPTYGKKIVLFDKEDFDLINKYKWRVYNNNNTFYTQAHTPMINGQRTTIKMHNLIMNAKFIDHINGNGLDNRKCNLRKANHTLNTQNRQRLVKNKTSKYKGVFYFKASAAHRKWRATIRVNGKELVLGYFPTENEAGIAYNNAATKYFKEFAYLNKVV